MAKERKSGFEKYKDMLEEPNESVSDNYFQKSYDKFRNSLNDEEYGAVQRYTGWEYEDINDYIRDGKMGSGDNQDMEELINQCESGLAKFKLDENIVVSRKSDDAIFKSLVGPDGNSVRYSYGDTPQTFVDKINHFKGAKVVDDGFTSTSTSRHVWHGNVWFEIQVPKGTNCAYVNPMSYNSGEREVILNRGTKFQIVSARTQRFDGEVRPIVTLKVIGRDKYDKKY